MRYRADIDGLRAVAVAPVVLFHAEFDLFAGGFVGVDVFFVISGYLITAIILEKIDAGTFSIVEFYERRARRILPALFLVMAVCAPVAWALLPPQQMRFFSQAIVATLAFASNLLFWWVSDYFAPAAHDNRLILTWSLALEEQFYVVFPILMIAIAATARRAMVPALALLAVGSLLLSATLTEPMPVFSYFMLPTRGWELLAGSLLAVTEGRRWRAPQPVREGAAALGLLLILGSVVAYDHDTPFPDLYALAPVAGSVALLAMAPGTLVGRALSAWPVLGVGLVSYSFYLWHQPALVFGRALDPDPSVAARLVACALALALAWASWRFVEQPFRNRGRVPLRALVISAAATGAVLAAVGLGGHVTQGWMQRLDPVQRAVLAEAAPSPRRAECHRSGANRIAPEQACVLPTEGAAAWAVFGNSHGVELAWSLARRLSAQGERVAQFTISGCPPSLRDDAPAPSRDCAAWHRATIRHLAERREIRNVVLTYRFRPPLEEDRADRDATAAFEAYWRDFEALVEAVLAAGKRVYVLAPTPELPLHVEAAIFAAGGEAARDIVAVSRAEHRRRFAEVLDRLGRMGDRVTVVDPADAYCDEAACYAVRDGVALYFDDNHPSAAGARRIPEAFD